MQGFSSTQSTKAFCRRIQVESYHIGSLATELRIRAHAPTLPALKMQVVLAHHPPASNRYADPFSYSGDGTTEAASVVASRDVFAVRAGKHG